ncbi:MAG: hypothetical protein KF734_10410 [Saprospiraceae bacterium]|nr:hypothetical protein [Saprospiraceae bacterium]
MFRRPQMPDVFERLEREASDDFRLLDELGPTHFGAEHLMELHARTRSRLALFKGRQRLAMFVGVVGAGWALLAVVLHFVGFRWPSFATLGAAALCFAGFLFIVFWQKKRFESKGELEYAQRVIEEELRRRAQLRREANR